jgi:hypothetical protein
MSVVSNVYVLMYVEEATLTDCLYGIYATEKAARKILQEQFQYEEADGIAWIDQMEVKG